MAGMKTVLVQACVNAAGRLSVQVAHRRHRRFRNHPVQPHLSYQAAR